jgi:hypothetical protein
MTLRLLSLSIKKCIQSEQRVFRTATAQEVYAIMDVPILTFTQNRRAVASREIEQGATGNPGMGHSRGIQLSVYNTLAAAEGVASKS